MRELSIDKAQVEKCVLESWNGRGENHLLSVDRAHAQQLNVSLNPTLAINSQPYTGKLNGQDIFQAIC